MDTPNFTQFSAAFSGDLVTPEGNDYSNAISRWAVNPSRKAAIVAFPKSVEDIQLAIKFAQDVGLPLAVRGGGYSCSGASSVEGDLVTF